MVYPIHHDMADDDIWYYIVLSDVCIGRGSVKQNNCVAAVFITHQLASLANVNWHKFKLFQFYIKTETQCDDATKFENKIIAFLLQNIISMKSVSLSRGLNLQHDIFNVRDTTNKYCHQPGQNCFSFLNDLQINYFWMIYKLYLFSPNYLCFSNTYHKYDITHLTSPTCL